MQNRSHGSQGAQQFVFPPLSVKAKPPHNEKSQYRRYAPTESTRPPHTVIVHTQANLFSDSSAQPLSSRSFVLSISRQ